MDELFAVKGQVVLVSGGSRGIGQAIAKGFADRGAQVVITGREEKPLQKTAEEMSTAEVQVCPLLCDVAKSQDIKRVVDQTLEKFGHIDTLINVAGVNRRKKAENFSEDDYDFIMNINLKGAWLLSQAVGRHMIQRGTGNQINIASLNTFRPLVGVGVYALSKAGMGAMTQSLATEWGPHGVRVNAIAPGFILTDLTNKLWSLPHMQAWNNQNCPMKRLGKPEDMVGASIFLASPAASFLTGQILYVDGGVTAGSCWPIDLDA